LFAQFAVASIQKTFSGQGRIHGFIAARNSQQSSQIDAFYEH